MAGLLRYQLFLSAALLLLSVWRASLARLDAIKSVLGVDPATTDGSSSIDLLVTYLPLWTVVLLGIYALSSVLHRVVTFDDCPGAADELGKQIVGAREKLKAAGFVF